MGKIKVVWGCPCSGKSTYAKEHMTGNDLVYDYDALITAMTGKTGRRVEKSKAHEMALAIRSLFIKLTSADSEIDAAYVLTRRPSKYLKGMLEAFESVEYIRMEATREECLARLALDDSRPDKDAWTAIINQWHDEEEGNEKPMSKQHVEIRLIDEIMPDWEEYNPQTGTFERVESPTGQHRFARELGSLTERDRVSIYVNCSGGSVKEALGISQEIRRCKAEVTAHVDGFAASAASVIAVSCDRVVMPRNTSMMIHPASCLIYGNAQELRKEADALDTITEQAVQTYAEKAGTKSSADNLRKLVNEETWLIAEECLALGLCDEVPGAEVDGPAMLEKYREASAKCKPGHAAAMSKEYAAKIVAMSAEKPASKMDTGKPVENQPEAAAHDISIAKMLKFFMEE